MEFLLEGPRLGLITKKMSYTHGKSRAWLVGYTLGDLPPQSLSPVYRAALVSEEGDVLTRLDEEIAGEEAIVFDCGGRQAAAISRDGGRPHIGKITVVTLERQPKTLLKYEPPSDGPFWDSKLYFLRERKQPIVVVKRDVLDFEGGRKWTEASLLRLDAKADRYVKTRELSEREAERLVAPTAGSAPVQKIELGAPPYDEAAEAKLKAVPRRQ